jgi:hypothetical protein
MYPLLYTLIVLLGTTSYVVGVRQMLQNKYSPSTFSRIIWLLLSVNSFFGVLLSGSDSSILLASIFMVGNLAICIVSFWKGSKRFGLIESVCTGLLIVSIFIWLFFDTPIINLIISLVAHFIGGVPTYRKVWANPQSESVGFWSLFFLASIVSLVTAQTFQIDKIIFPIYFILFDGSMFLLAFRKKYQPADSTSINIIQI